MKIPIHVMTRLTKEGLRFSNPENNIRIVDIWIDGSGNNKTHTAGGCGIILKYGEHEKRVSVGQYINTTTARCEIHAAIEALKLVKDKKAKIKLYCDNQYVVKSWSEEWLLNWEVQGWVGRKNKDILQQLLLEIRKFPKGYVQFFWVKGHAENQYNELADQLAAEGGKKDTLIDDTEITSPINKL